MSKAPNETDAGYARKLELMVIRDQRRLTDEELVELKELTTIAISHLVFGYPTAGGATIDRYKL
jgi:hypothetical protein